MDHSFPQFLGEGSLADFAPPVVGEHTFGDAEAPSAKSIRRFR
ncbi:hypothetical protein ART_0426 [Arthrobacter sp. PAMC 25486]|nr:hypothetical protein ART_0426 [Arthrobacter sp. PAMC 25486]